jgi:hypothetical protein
MWRDGRGATRRGARGWSDSRSRPLNGWKCWRDLALSGALPSAGQTFPIGTGRPTRREEEHDAPLPLFPRDARRRHRPATSVVVSSRMQRARLLRRLHVRLPSGVRWPSSPRSGCPLPSAVAITHSSPPSFARAGSPAQTALCRPPGQARPRRHAWSKSCSSSFSSRPQREPSHPAPVHGLAGTVHAPLSATSDARWSQRWAARAMAAAPHRPRRRRRRRRHRLHRRRRRRPPPASAGAGTARARTSPTWSVRSSSRCNAPALAAAACLRSSRRRRLGSPG